MSELWRSGYDVSAIAPGWAEAGFENPVPRHTLGGLGAMTVPDQARQLRQAYFSEVVPQWENLRAVTAQFGYSTDAEMLSFVKMVATALPMTAASDAAYTVLPQARAALAYYNSWKLTAQRFFYDYGAALKAQDPKEYSNLSGSFDVVVKRWGDLYLALRESPTTVFLKSLPEEIQRRAVELGVSEGIPWVAIAVFLGAIWLLK